jgi:triosephosphate isomerase
MSGPQGSSGAGRTPLVLGNWKMNGDAASTRALLDDLLAAVGAWGPSGIEAGVCPPYPYLGLAAQRLAGTRIGWGAQDVSAHQDGAFTGEVSARMLAEFGCGWVLVGHSERRTLCGETDADVARKSERALAAGLVPVVCVGETRGERESGAAEAVLGRQVDAVSDVLRGAGGRFVIAYEPVWAIGTGLTATPDQAQAAHAFIRARLAQRGIVEAPAVRLLYGGSMKPGNAAELLARPDVDGGLVGGAALVAADFTAILQAAAARA